MNMTKQFLAQKLDEAGRPVINVIWNDETERWEEQEQQTDSFKLFKTLKIYQCQHATKHTEDQCMKGICEDRDFFYKNCGTHIVVFVNLQTVCCHTKEVLQDELKASLREAYLEHEYLLEETSRLSQCDKDMISRYTSTYLHEKLTETNVSKGLRDLVGYLVKYFEHVDKASKQPKTNSLPPKRKVFIMVEEYDAPVSLLLEQEEATEKYIKEVIQTIGIMISGVLKDNPNVIGGMVNACRNVKGSLLNYANNIDVIVFLEDKLFFGYFGFTDDELDGILKKREFRHVEKDALTEFYNGYHQLNKPEKRVYITYSILMHLEAWNKERKEKHQTPEKGVVKLRPYFVDRGVEEELSKLLAIDRIREKIVDILEKQTIEISNTTEKLSVRELFLLKKLLCHSPCEEIDENQITLFFHHLSHHGFLFATSGDESSIILEIPNKEIVATLHKMLWSSTFYEKKYTVKPAEYVKALLALDREKHATFQDLAQGIANMFPSLLPQRHDELKGILYSFALASGNFKNVQSESYVIPGRLFRCDLKIWRKDGMGIIIEVASANKNADEALNQIFTNHYSVSLDNQEKCIGKVYIGLFYDYAHGGVKICAHVSDGKTITETWSQEQKQYLIRKDVKRNV